jgi:hypothetical protein
MLLARNATDDHAAVRPLIESVVEEADRLGMHTVIRDAESLRESLIYRACVVTSLRTSGRALGDEGRDVRPAYGVGQRIVPTPGISGRSSAVTQPGGRSLTAGTALRARSPVARHPAVAASRPLASLNRKAVSWVIDGVPSISTR